MYRGAVALCSIFVVCLGKFHLLFKPPLTLYHVWTINGFCDDDEREREMCERLLEREGEREREVSLTFSSNCSSRCSSECLHAHCN